MPEGCIPVRLCPHNFHPDSRTATEGVAPMVVAATAKSEAAGCWQVGRDGPNITGIMKFNRNNRSSKLHILFHQVCKYENAC